MLQRETDCQEAQEPLGISEAASVPAQVWLGEVCWVGLDLPREEAKFARCARSWWVAASALNRARRTVIAVPLSTGPSLRPPIVVETPLAEADSVAVCDQGAGRGQAPADPLHGATHGN